MNHDPKRAADRLDLLLEACNPVERSTLRNQAIESALDEIGGEITSRPRRARGPFLGRSLRTVLVAAAIVVTTAAVAAAGWSAHTGIFQPTQEQIAGAGPDEAARMKSELAMGGPGEFLNAAAPDFPEVALQIAADIPYPQGYESWRDFLISLESRTATGEDLRSEGALHGWFAANAFIAWVQAWRQADVAGDTEAATQAARVISEAPGWKAVTDEDPHPDPSVPGDGGFTKHTLFGWMLPYRDAVLTGDRARVEHLLASAYGSWSYTGDPEWNAQLEAHPEWSVLSGDEIAQKYMQFLDAGRPRPEPGAGQRPTTTTPAASETTAPPTTVQPTEGS